MKRCHKQRSTPSGSAIAGVERHPFRAIGPRVWNHCATNTVFPVTGPDGVAETGEANYAVPRFATQVMKPEK
jgi:hypothetical protein